MMKQPHRHRRLCVEGLGLHIGSGKEPSTTQHDDNSIEHLRADSGTMLMVEEETLIIVNYTRRRTREFI